MIFGSINAFPSSYIRSPWHRFMSEKGPHSKLAQVCARHPPHHSLFLVIFGNIYKRDTEPEIYSRAAFRQRKSAPVTGCDQSLSLPLFFIPSFFTDQSNFRLSERGGRKGPDEGCWDGRKDRGPPHTHKLKNTDLQPYFYVYAQREDAGCKRCWRAGKEWACNRIPGPWCSVYTFNSS